MKVILWLGLSIASAIAYHLGGKGGFKGAKLIRRVGCSLLALGLFWDYRALLGLQGLNLGHWWAYCLFIILNYMALSTYWDILTQLWRGNEDEYWENWFLTGCGYGLAAIPLLWCGVALWAIIGRAIFLAITIMWLRERTGKVEIEELGSGFLYCASMPLLLL